MEWVVFALAVGIGLGHVNGAYWTHSAQLDPNYSLFWAPGEQDITFEVHVRTLGYIGFGFSQDGNMAGADMVVAWIHHGTVFFQDRHALDHGEPDVDSSQDYEMLHGYENDTHTVIRFRRRYDTCDPNDFRITNDTMRLLYAYGSEDSLRYHGHGQRGSRSLYLLERVNMAEPLPADVRNWDLKNSEVTLPAFEDTLYWCKIFKFPNMKRKYHMVRYEPLFDPGSRDHIRRVTVYECQGRELDFEVYSNERGEVCYQPTMPAAFQNCNNVVIAWGAGSEGFSFPPEVGYPLNSEWGPKYFMMETHYSISPQDVDVTDSSGIRMYYTSSLRVHDAGVFSMGMDPHWRHIIPPEQPQVVSEGHCISACTQHYLPPTGITMFAATLHTHWIGRKVRLRQLRKGIELPTIVADNNYDPSYQEIRQLPKPVQLERGDHLIVECEYNSTGRTTITLGGLSSREEMCLVFGYYYPRTDLFLCRSSPSLPTVLNSLGIQELWPGSSPVRIKSPSELADMTLEDRLVSYDWENNFHSFEEATHKGSFKPLCGVKKPALLPRSIEEYQYYPNITRAYEEDYGACHHVRRKPRRRKKPGENGEAVQNTKVYNSIAIQDASMLNSGVRTAFFWWLLTTVTLYILL